MKEYVLPTAEITELHRCDVITASPGTETPRYDDEDGIWEYGIENT